MSAAYRVGDRVSVRRGRSRLTGEITEDRGPIGVGGRRLYGVRAFIDPDEIETFELPEEAIEPLDEAAERNVVLDKKKVMRFLAHGGLVAILRADPSGGRNPPRVWLRPDTIGNITYTFAEERGVVGGQVIPFGVERDHRILMSKRDEVVSFLQSFRLSREDAERVVSLVGTAP